MIVACFHDEGEFRKGTGCALDVKGVGKHGALGFLFCFVLGQHSDDDFFSVPNLTRWEAPVSG